MNCHFTLAALIGLGMYGIKNKLELDIPPISAPGTCFDSNSLSYDTELAPCTADETKKTKRLAKTLLEATETMMRPESLARVVLGDEFVDHFGATRLHEWDTFTQTVTTWEIEVSCRTPIFLRFAKLILVICSDTWNWLKGI